MKEKIDNIEKNMTMKAAEKIKKFLYFWFKKSRKNFQFFEN